MKHIFKLFVFISLTLLMGVGCAKKEPVKVGFLMHSLDKERWENDRDFFIQKVRELGGSVLIKVANNDANIQYQQAKELLRQGVKVLVVIPVDQFAAAKIVEEAHAKNVKVISYDRLILNCPLDYYVSTDNVKIGELQAEYLTKVSPKGDYALIGGSINDHNSQFLYIGQMNILQPLVEKGNIKIVYNELTNAWEESEGYEHAQKLLAKTNNRVDAIIAGNDALALGALRALQEKGLAGKVLIAGMDADLQNLREIAKGNITCTVYKPIEKLASTAAQIAMRLAGGGKCEKMFQTVSNGEVLVPSVLQGAKIVNKENLKLTVISEGYQKEEEIFR
ncbi:MAG: sugar ABC transporter substrate-binding protein [Chlorobi bacterium]|nr:sugar ABC transporter substrate-binding protein [Chlorobiota bacterium]